MFFITGLLKPSQILEGLIQPSVLPLRLRVAVFELGGAWLIRVWDLTRPTNVPSAKPRLQRTPSIEIVTDLQWKHPAIFSHLPKNPPDSHRIVHCHTSRLPSQVWTSNFPNFGMSLNFHLTSPTQALPDVFRSYASHCWVGIHKGQVARRVDRRPRGWIDGRQRQRAARVWGGRQWPRRSPGPSPGRWISAESPEASGGFSEVPCGLCVCINTHIYIHTYITLHYITLHYITLHYITYIHTYIHTHTHIYMIYIYMCVCVIVCM